MTAQSNTIATDGTMIYGLPTDAPCEYICTKFVETFERLPLQALAMLYVASTEEIGPDHWATRCALVALEQRTAVMWELRPSTLRDDGSVPANSGRRPRII